MKVTLMQVRLLILFLLCTPFILHAQLDSLLTIEDVGLARLRPDSPRSVEWEPGGSFFTWMSSGLQHLVRYQPKSGKQDTLYLDRFASLARMSGIPDVKRFPQLKWLSADSGWFLTGGKLAVLNRADETIRIWSRLPASAENIDVSADLKVAFTVGNALKVSLRDSVAIPVGEPSFEGEVYGKAPHQREFGITKGTFWSPSGRFLAFYRSDDRPVTRYPLVDITSRPAEVKPFMYPMAGEANHLVTVGVFDTKTGKTTWLPTGEPADQYLTNLTWQPDESALWVVHVNRGQDSSRIVRYPIGQGSPATMLTETDQVWIEPEHGPVFLPGSDGDWLWLSRRDGWDHLYRYDKTGRLKKQVTSGKWNVLSVDKVSPDGSQLVLTTTRKSPLGRQILQVSTGSGKITPIGSGDQMNWVTPSPDAKQAVVFTQSPVQPGQLVLYKGGNSKPLLLHQSPDPYKTIHFSKPEFFSIRSVSGDSLYGQLYKPIGFDPARKYPVILYVYGGPHNQLVTNSWPQGVYHLWFQYMAQRGFIVIQLDNRGTPNRGKAFEQAIFRRAGTVEMEDQLAGLDWLSQFSWADMSRVGVFGWSYGGFMTATLMTKAPDRFKAGVSGAPVIDWSYYETVYTERYMDTPVANPEGYKTSSVLNSIGNLKGRLLMIHGTHDNVVMWQHSLLLVSEAIRNSVQMDYFVYPGHLHGVAGKDRVHLFEKISRHFLENL